MIRIHSLCFRLKSFNPIKRVIKSKMWRILGLFGFEGDMIPKLNVAVSDDDGDRPDDWYYCYY